MLEKTLFRTDEVAEYFHINNRTVYNWRKNGLLKGVKIGGAVFFRKEDIAELLEKMAEKAKNE